MPKPTTIHGTVKAKYWKKLSQIINDRASFHIQKARTDGFSESDAVPYGYHMAIIEYLDEKFENK